MLAMDLAVIFEKIMYAREIAKFWSFDLGLREDAGNKFSKEITVR